MTEVGGEFYDKGLDQESMVRPDVLAMQQARVFFERNGFAIDAAGLVENTLSTEQLRWLKDWHRDTSGKEEGQWGAEMPTEELFYQKVLLAVSLWPQVSATQNFHYLLGKGAGIEIALRGIVADRQPQGSVPAYRSHSDFELYNVPYNAGSNGAYISGTTYSDAFREVFGGQEIFPVTRTKGLRNLPPTLLSDTAERVDLGGVDVWLPELELLFLDKFNATESTPRNEGYDHELLAKRYALDRTKVQAYFEAYVKNPALEQIEANRSKDFTYFLENVQRRLTRMQQPRGEASEAMTLAEAVERLNKDTQFYIDIRDEADRNNVVVGGIALAFWEPIRSNQVDEKGLIVDPEYVGRLQGRIASDAARRTVHWDEAQQELDQLFDRIEASRNDRN